MFTVTIPRNAQNDPSRPTLKNGCSKIPLYATISIQVVSNDVSQFKISLHQFENCLGQVKINITTATEV